MSTNRELALRMNAPAGGEGSTVTPWDVNVRHADNERNGNKCPKSNMSRGWGWGRGLANNRIPEDQRNTTKWRVVHGRLVVKAAPLYELLWGQNWERQ